MEWRDRLRSFVQRTKRNLDHIDAERAGGNAAVYEITQLVNSLLGLIVFPREYSERNVFPIPKDASSATVLFGERLEVHVRWGSGARKPIDESFVLERMRHALAHFGIEPKIDEDGEIASLTFYNRDPKRKDDWAVVGPIPIADMRGLVSSVTARILGSELSE